MSLGPPLPADYTRSPAKARHYKDIGSPTWARTRDLRINRLAFNITCKPHKCSIRGVCASNSFSPLHLRKTRERVIKSAGYWKCLTWPSMGTWRASALYRKAHRGRKSKAPTSVETRAFLRRTRWYRSTEERWRSVNIGASSRTASLHTAEQSGRQDPATSGQSGIEKIAPAMSGLKVQQPQIDVRAQSDEISLKRSFIDWQRLPTLRLIESLLVNGSKWRCRPIAVLRGFLVD